MSKNYRRRLKAKKTSLIEIKRKFWSITLPDLVQIILFLVFATGIWLSYNQNTLLKESLEEERDYYKNSLRPYVFPQPQPIIHLLGDSNEWTNFLIGITAKNIGGGPAVNSKMSIIFSDMELNTDSLLECLAKSDKSGSIIPVNDSAIAFVDTSVLQVEKNYGFIAKCIPGKFAGLFAYQELSLYLTTVYSSFGGDEFATICVYKYFLASQPQTIGSIYGIDCEDYESKILVFWQQTTSKDTSFCLEKEGSLKK